MINIDYLDEYETLFPIPYTNIVQTTGIGKGVIIKFKTFYIKLYNEDCYTYELQAFRYNGPTPIINKTLEYQELRSFCAQFKQDNFLFEFENLNNDLKCM